MADTMIGMGIAKKVTLKENKELEKATAELKKASEVNTELSAKIKELEDKNKELEKTTAELKK